ncbi:MAG TPA: tyrosine-type recombinase/integrase [Chloroflexota bacterium]|jgi:integrase
MARLTLASGKRKCFYGKLRQDVQRQLVAALRDQQQGVPIVGGRQTLAQFLEHWLIDVVKPAVRPRTYEAYHLNVRRLVPLIGRERLVGLTPAKIQAAYGTLLETGSSRSAKGLSRRSVEQAHVVLHTALRYAVRSRVLAYNPADAVLAPRPDRQEMETLSVEQVQQLFDNTADDRWHALWVLLGTTGLRHGEATGLKWEDLDLTTGQLTVRRSLQRQRGNGLVMVEPKTTRSRRTIHLTAAALAALRRHRVQQAEARLAAGPAWQERGLVFCTYAGGPLDPARINEAFHRALDRAGLPRRRVHDLRHSVASVLLALGVPVHDVSAILGHCQAAVTLNVYAHVTARGQAEAIQKLDALLVAR